MDKTDNTATGRSALCWPAAVVPTNRRFLPPGVTGSVYRDILVGGTEVEVGVLLASSE